MTDRQSFFTHFGSSEVDAEHEWRKQMHIVDAKAKYRLEIIIINENNVYTASIFS